MFLFSDARAHVTLRLDEIRALIGQHSLARLDEVIARRRQYLSRLRGHLESACRGRFQLQSVPQGVVPNGQNLAVLWRGAAQTEDVIDALRLEGVEGRRYFWPALHTLEYFADHGALPVTEDVTEHVLCLPLHARMDEASLLRVESATTRVAQRLG